MKPRYRNKQTRPHRLPVDFDEGKSAECPVSLVSPGITAAAGLLPAPALDTGRKVLMLVSGDAGLGVRLGHTADLAGLAFVQISDSANALRLAARHSPAVACLDLDLPELAVWEAAERLLQDETGPSLILLSGRTDHFDLGAAMRMGAVTDKLSEPARLLEQVGGILAQPEVIRGERRARLRRLVRWLRPYDWGLASVESTPRYWGINE